MKDKFQRINLEEASLTPNEEGHYRLIKDHYWILDKDGFGLIYKGYAIQANRIQGILKCLVESSQHPGVEEKFYETIFIKEDVYGDY